MALELWGPGLPEGKSEKPASKVPASGGKNGYMLNCAAIVKERCRTAYVDESERITFKTGWALFYSYAISAGMEQYPELSAPD